MRKRIDFWLQMGNPEHEWLLDVISSLKRSGQFAKTVRDGIRLIVALREQEWSVLFEMFPEVRYQQLPGSLQPPVYRLPAAGDGDVVTQLVDEAIKLVS